MHEYKNKVYVLYHVYRFLFFFLKFHINIYTSMISESTCLTKSLDFLVQLLTFIILRVGLLPPSLRGSKSRTHLSLLLSCP